MPRLTASTYSTFAPNPRSDVSIVSRCRVYSMRARLQCFWPRQSIALRPQPSACPSQTPLCLRLTQKRNISADKEPPPETQKPKGPNQDALPHVSEEAAIEGKITGDGGPDLEQSTPVEEVSQEPNSVLCSSLSLLKVLKRDEKSQEKAPKILQSGASSSSSKGTRSYSTTARRRATTQALVNPESAEVQRPGYIFDLPALPLPSNSHLKHRYDPIVEQVTNLLMRDGKKGVAQRVRLSVPLPLPGQPAAMYI